jgi:putative transposase
VKPSKRMLGDKAYDSAERRNSSGCETSHPQSMSASNVLNRTFEAAAPNRKWIADFTYVWTTEGWLYVAAVIDLFSRRVVGWSMSASMTAQLVTDTLVMAIWRRGKPDALLDHFWICLTACHPNRLQARRVIWGNERKPQRTMP